MLRVEHSTIAASSNFERMDDLNPVIHAPHRLKLCAMLSPLEEAEFQLLREELGVSESVLSKHVTQLVDAGYVKVRQGATNGRARKWASLTSRGRKAFAAHVRALRNLVDLAGDDRN